MAVRAKRITDSPIVSYGSVPGYGAIFNAGVVHHDDRYHLFARGIRAGYTRNTGSGPRFLDYLSDILVFESSDGLDYEFRYTLAESGASSEVHCFEDPRVQMIGSGGDIVTVMTYTNLPPVESGEPWRIGAHLLNYDTRFHLEPASRTLLGPDAIANKDAVVFNLADGRVAMIHRVHPNMQLAVFDDIDHLWSADAGYWDSHVADLEQHTIIRPAPGALGVGAGAPPVRTDEGLLLFFHERRSDGVYTMNIALLSEQTGRVVSMLEDALLEPELHWEREGDVDNVVFVQGAHLREDGYVYLTYGAADSCVGAAIASARELTDSLIAAAR